MKKFMTFLLALFCLAPALLFVACDKNAKPIDASTYFSQAVTYTVYGKSGQFEEKLSDLTDSKFDNQTKYQTLTITGNTAWLYKMTVKKVEFEIRTNEDVELQFILHISNLRNTDKDADQNPKFIAVVNAKKGKAVKFAFEINDYFESVSATSTFILELDGSQYYYANGASSDGS